MGKIANRYYSKQTSGRLRPIFYGSSRGHSEHIKKKSSRIRPVDRPGELTLHTVSYELKSIRMEIRKLVIIPKIAWFSDCRFSHFPFLGIRCILLYKTYTYLVSKRKTVRIHFGRVVYCELSFIGLDEMTTRF